MASQQKHGYVLTNSISKCKSCQVLHLFVADMVDGVWGFLACARELVVSVEKKPRDRLVILTESQLKSSLASPYGGDVWLYWMNGSGSRMDQRNSIKRKCCIVQF